MVWTPNLARRAPPSLVPSFLARSFCLGVRRMCVRLLHIPYRPRPNGRQAARTVITAVERPKMQFVILLAATPALRLAPLVTRSFETGITGDEEVPPTAGTSGEQFHTTSDERHRQRARHHR